MYGLQSQLYYYEKTVYTAMVNNSTNINKANNPALLNTCL